MVEAQKQLEVQQLMLTGVDPFMSEKDVIKYLRKVFSTEKEIPCEGIAKKRGNTYCFISFSANEQKDRFQELYTKSPENKKAWRLKENTQSHVQNKKFKLVKDNLPTNGERPIFIAPTQEAIDQELKQTVIDRVTPYSHLSYDEQIKIKKEWLLDILQGFNKQFFKNMDNGQEIDVPPWFTGEIKEAGVPCPLLGVIECDEEHRKGYRNKVEFTIGKRKYLSEAEEICVGFTVGNMSKGIQSVDYPDKISVISKSSLKSAKMAEKMVIESGLEPFDKVTLKGFWRLLLFRESKKTKEVLISFIVSEELDKEKLEEMKTLIAKTFPVGMKFEQGLNLVSLSLITSNEISGGYRPDDPITLLGETKTECYTDELQGYKFTVNPMAFFQVNTNVFEKMLSKIEEWAEIDDQTILFDICCGTGAIGICLQQKAMKVIGIELIEQAVENAKINTNLNSDRIKAGKCEWYAGKAEVWLPKIVKDYSSKGYKIVGIVDPPRSGLHKDVLKALRTCKGLDSLIYVSCNPQSQMRDLEFLCYAHNQSRRKGPAFQPISCIGADLFPDTNHCESLVKLERFYGSESNKQRHIEIMQKEAEERLRSENE